MNSVIGEIQELLVSTGGYRQILMPLRVGDIEFRFDAVLMGPTNADDLAVIVDLQEIVGNAIRRRIRGLVTVLDRLKSRRSVSVILVVRNEFKFELEDLDKYCHVCVVRPEKALESSLRSLLPLKLPEPSTAYANAGLALRQEIGSAKMSKIVTDLIDKAMIGAEAIQEQLKNEFDKIVDEMERSSKDE